MLENITAGLYERNGTDISSPSLRMDEAEERTCFRDAFLTEIGDELDQMISSRELFDVIVCAGKDIDVPELDRLRLRTHTNKEALSFEDAFSIFHQIPPIDYGSLAASLNTFTLDGQIDYDRLIRYFEAMQGEKKTAVQENVSRDQMLSELLNWFGRKREEGSTTENIIAKLYNSRRQLLELNTRIVANLREPAMQKNLSKLDLPNVGSSTESLSSMFSTRNMALTEEERSAKLSPSVHPASAELANGGKLTRKSLVIQKSASQSACVAYSFTLERAQRVRILMYVNDKVDSSLSRFQNSILGILARKQTQGTLSSAIRIIGVTRKKENDNGAMATEWLQLSAGSYIFQAKFCRPLKMVEPERSDEIMDSQGRLTKPFKVMLMNLYDTFDLDDDGLLSKAEFDAYSQLSGSGKVNQEEWTRIGKEFCLRENHIAMPTFILMHQKEAESHGNYADRLKDMWMAVRELGHNRKFMNSTACPLRVEFYTSDSALPLEEFEIAKMCAEDPLDKALLTYFWENGTPLPYLKEESTLRQFKADYYVILVAGYSAQLEHYKLDLSMSNSVNIEGSELTIDKIVQPNTMQILTVAMALGTGGWFLSVKKSVK